MVDIFLAQMEEIVFENQRIQAMDIVFKGTLTRQWVTHYVNLQEWVQVMECVKLRFYPMTKFELMIQYKGTKDPQEHICFYKSCWTINNIPSTQWARRFVHTMDMVSRSQYILEETRRKTWDWKEVSSQFFQFSNFMSEVPAQMEILLKIKDFIFHRHPKDTTQKFVYTYHKPMEKLKQSVYCWNVNSDDMY